MLKELNHAILKSAPRHIVKAEAPNTFRDVLAQFGELVIWSGASESTIFDDPKVNYAFRALHDALHIETRLDFSPIQEIAIGRIQASRYDGLLADLVFIETAGQAAYFLQHGKFVENQRQFTLDALKALGYKI